MKGVDYMYKVIIAGSREFQDYQLMKSKLDFYLSQKSDIEIVSGTAYGADALGEYYANVHKLPIKRFPADWNKYGKSAGYKRNKQMAEYADACIVFWNGKSKGTKLMIELAKQYNLALRIVYF